MATAWQRKWLDMDVTHPDLQTVAAEVQEFCKRFSHALAGAKMLVLHGNPGCGKTHIARRVSLWSRNIASALLTLAAWKNAPELKYAHFPAICDGFKDGHYGVVDDMMEADLLILDDIGAEHDPSKNAADKLCQVLSKREKKWTLITTNIQPGSWPDKFDARIADRLLRNSKVVDMSKIPSYAIWTLQQK